MIIIQNYMQNSQTFICSLNHEQIGELFFDEKIAASYPGDASKTSMTHWIAEPSKIKEIIEFCEKHGHFCDEVVKK